MELDRSIEHWDQTTKSYVEVDLVVQIRCKRDRTTKMQERATKGQMATDQEKLSNVNQVLINLYFIDRLNVYHINEGMSEDCLMDQIDLPH